MHWNPAAAAFVATTWATSGRSDDNEWAGSRVFSTDRYWSGYRGNRPGPVAVPVETAQIKKTFEFKKNDK